MNKYITVMFPYPSGSGLHIGHWYNYSIVDSYCKIQKRKGNNVFQPFGFDSFGLPAENYAKTIGGDVKQITEANINNFQNEMKRMNTSFEWKFNTHSENYQNRTKWLFNCLLNAGLAYKALREENYCPSCNTVLAREQVKDNKCDRCSTKIVKKELNQWFFKISNYKERLIKDLNNVDYPEKTKKQQINWINDPKFMNDWCVSRQRKWGCKIPVDGETDTLDTFVDSSFYTIEYDKTRPVDIYIGGSEHACMHLIYSRFITKFLFDIGYINFDEPFKKVIHQGMILGTDGEKMSKSKGNVINPINYEPQLLRMNLMFINHYFDGGKWQDSAYKGVEKFRNRLFNWFNNSNSNNYLSDTEIEKFENNVISYFESWKVNKVISEWMIFYNIHKSKKLNNKQINYLKKFFNDCF